METLLVFTNLPDRESADALARTLVERGLAACVSVLGGCRSTYRWEGEIETADEVTVLIKTTPSAYAALERAIVELHSYELPEIVAIPVSRGLPAYLQWVSAETQT